MKALCWHGKNNVGIETVPDPKIINPRDVVLKITTTAICGSDLHLYGGHVPTLMRGDILGHEFMGEVMEKGSAVKNLAVGDRVVVPFNISCGTCRFCSLGLYSSCDNSNPNSWLSQMITGQPCGGLFGYTHMCGGYAGGQAEYVRVPFADFGCLKVPEGIPDEKVLFLSDIFPTGYMAAENCNISPGDTVAIWGAGPVGQFAVRSAFLLGAERVIVVDNVAERLRIAAEAGAIPVNYDEHDVYETILDMTQGDGADSCIDAVGMEAHGHSIDSALDNIKTAMKIQFDKIHALRQAVHACRKSGVVSVPGVYIGFVDKFNFGQAFNKGITFKMGQTHTQKYMWPLLERILENQIDPSFIISHRLNLEDAPNGYKNFREDREHVSKIVMHMN